MNPGVAQLTFSDSGTLKLAEAKNSSRGVLVDGNEAVGGDGVAIQEVSGTYRWHGTAI